MVWGPQKRARPIHPGLEKPGFSGDKINPVTGPPNNGLPFLGIKFGDSMQRLHRFNQLYKSICTPQGALPFAGTLLQQAAHRWPTRTALIFNQEHYTFQDLYTKAARVSHYLHKQGATPQDRIIILYENSPLFFIAYYGIWQTGAIVVPVNTFLQEAELNHIIEDCDARFILVSDKLKSKIPAAHADRMISEELITKLMSQEDHDSVTIPEKPAEELAALLYTSGTTGLPKGVMLSSRNIITNALQCAAAFTITDAERVYAALPLFHSYLQNCCLWTAFMVGASTILVAKIDRTNLLNGLAAQPTVVLGIPQLYGLFCLMKGVTFPAVKFFICGGDALPDRIRKGFELIFRRKICNGYGLTETSPAVSVHLEDEYTATNNVGKPVANLTIKLDQVNDHGIGEITVKADNVMLGYYHAPQATQEILKEGSLYTGDLGTFDHDGNLYICGRAKDLIVNKGIKIYPQEVENVLMSHPLVMAAGVIGVADHDAQIPIAFVAVRTPTPQLEQELMDLCKQRLAAYKVPRSITIERELPMTATQKVDKKVLRARFKA